MIQTIRCHGYIERDAQNKKISSIKKTRFLVLSLYKLTEIFDTFQEKFFRSDLLILVHRTLLICLIKWSYIEMNFN